MSECIQFNGENSSENQALIIENISIPLATFSEEAWCWGKQTSGSNITKTRLFKYIENLPPKTEHFRYKNSDEAVLSSTHNPCFWAEIRKIMNTPVNPSFTI